MIVHRENIGLMTVPLASSGNVNCPKALKHFKRSTLVIMPGYNEMPDEVWEELVNKFSKIRYELKSEEMKEFKPEIKEKKVGKGENEKIIKQKKGKEFKDLDIEDAKSIIADTNSIEALNKFAEKEERADVRNIILDRIKEIQDYGKNK